MLFANNKKFFNNVLYRSPSYGLKTDGKSNRNRNRKRQNFQTATETRGMVETDIFDYLKDHNKGHAKRPYVRLTLFDL